MKIVAKCMASLVVVFAALGFAVRAAEASVIYVTNGDSNVMQAYDLTTGSQVFSKNTSGRLYAIAVRDTVWLGHLSNASNTAREFDLNGDPTGNTATMSSFSRSQLLDGTTDGVSNYAIRWNTGEVYQANLDWSGMSSTPLFDAPANDITGITYDSASGNLWLSNNTTAFEYSLTGTLLSSFSHGAGRNGLAYDATTDSLWFVPNNENAALRQYSTTGTLLGTLNTPTRSGNIWGAEIAFAAQQVPEPASIAVWSVLLLTVAGATFYLRRNKLQPIAG